MFETYFQLGLEHITDLNGYDHILFLIALCAAWQVKDWRRILVLVTAFTVGHSLTLALAAYNIVVLPGALVEVLIPVTIVLTALLNLRTGVGIIAHYSLALGFGLIHGLAFSNFFRHLLGRDTSVIGPLLSFNLGVEAGQLLIVAAFLAANALFTSWMKVPQKYWMIGFSLLAFGLGIQMIVSSEFFN